MRTDRPRARLLVCGVQAVIRVGGEQGPPRRPDALTASSRAWGLSCAHVARKGTYDE